METDMGGVETDFNHKRTRLVSEGCALKGLAGPVPTRSRHPGPPSRFHVSLVLFFPQFAHPRGESG